MSEDHRFGSVWTTPAIVRAEFIVDCEDGINKLRRKHPPVDEVLLNIHLSYKILRNWRHDREYFWKVDSFSAGQ